MLSVTIVGAGICGLATAFHLQRDGAKTVVLERARPGHEGSGRNAGGVRQQGRVPDEIPLAIEAIAAWATLEQELGGPTEYRRTGNLLVSQSPKQTAQLEKRAERQRPFSIDSQMITGTEARRLCPALPSTVEAALYCPSDGQANPLLTTSAFAQAAARAGADIRSSSEVLEVAQFAGGWRVRLAEYSIDSDYLVLAAGPGNVALCETIGFSLPVVNCRVQTLITERLPPILPQFVQDWTTNTFARQTASGGVLFGDLGEDFVHADHRVTAADAVRAAAGAIAALPFLADAMVVRSWGGTIDVSLDEKPIIGDLPDYPGLFVSAGSSGHGFALAPVVGRLLAAWIMNAQVSPLLKPFGPRRFAMGGMVGNIDGSLQEAV